MKSTKMLLSMLAICSLLVYTGCDDDDDDNGGAAALTVSSITAAGTDLETGEPVADIDLNAASSAENVPLDAVITVTFNKDVDAATATSDNVSLSSDAGDVPISVSASGSSLTIDPDEDLERGTSYTLNLSGDLKADDGGSFTSLSRTFTSAGRAEVTPPQEESQVAYFAFDGNAEDAEGTYNADAEVDITYGEDRFGQQGSAAAFNGNTSIIEVPNGAALLTENWTLSYWARVDTVDHLNADGNNAGHFIMGVGAFHGFQIETGGDANFWKMAARYSKEDGTTIPNDFFVDANGQNAANGGWEAIEEEANVSGGLKTIQAQNWHHVVVTYNATENKRAVYMNGQLIERDNLSIPTDLSTVNGLTFDDSGTADVIGQKLAFGFAFDRSTTLWSGEPWGSYELETSNHFKGSLDDVRFFNAALTAEEVQTLYNAEAP